jgi:hypothetical protein
VSTVLLLCGAASAALMHGRRMVRWHGHRQDSARPAVAVRPHPVLATECDSASGPRRCAGSPQGRRRKPRRIPVRYAKARVFLSATNSLRHLFTMETHPGVLAKRRQIRGVPSDEAICEEHNMSRQQLDILWLSALAVCVRCKKSNPLRRLACANCSAPLAWECTSCTTMNLLSVVSCCACGELTRRE